jgi:sensor histidine kinase YesM
MAITNLKKYEHSFIILAALVISFLYTLPFLSSLFNATPDATNPFQNSSFILKRSAWYFGHSFVSLLIFIYFNYTWASFITPRRAKKIFRVLLLIAYDIVLATGLLWATVFIAEYTIGNPFGIRGAVYWYMWKYILILPLAAIFAFMLNLVVKAKIIEIENYKLKQENLNNQLKTLQDQVNPHFLFNTLNTLSSLVRRGKNRESLQFIDDLSNVYRYILESDNTDLVSVNSELEFARSYISMLEKRFGKGLNIRISIADEMMKTLVPPMAFQLLIENAIKHNRISEASPLMVEIYNDHNNIIVSNNIQKKSEPDNSLGLGLPNLIHRYRLVAEKDVSIQQKEDHFIVTLPIIRP